ncbi:MAG: stage II sporulation protein M [Clostridia bacterium]|nr:stage II sporulation protein M [Clostridia bacterium]
MFKSINRHFNVNKSKYFFLLLALVVGLVSGILFSSSVKPEDTEKLTQTVNIALTGIEDKGKAGIFFDYLWKNAKSVLLIFFGTYSLYALPLVFLNLILSGFSMGFTAAFVTSYFGFKGFLISLIVYSTDLLLCIPMLFFMSTVAIDYTLHNSKMKSTIKIRNRKKFLIICCIFLLVLTALSLPNVFVFPKIVKSLVP